MIHRLERRGSSSSNDFGSWFAQHAREEVEEDGDLVGVVEGDEESDVGGVKLKDGDEEVDVRLTKVAKGTGCCG